MRRVFGPVLLAAAAQALLGPSSAQDAPRALGPSPMVAAPAPRAVISTQSATDQEPPSATVITTPTVTVTPLGAPGRAGAGVLPASVTGLPADIWAGSDASLLARRIAALPAQTPRAAGALERTLMLAEAGLPRFGDPDVLLAARLDRLIASGHLESAAALADRAGATSLALRRRAFDIALLIGDETRACGHVDPAPESSGDYARRVFCLVRTGDWAAGATTYDSAAALGRLDPVDAALLAPFLDPEVAEGPLPNPPRAPTPLQFRLYDALGAPLATRPLAVPYARADMRPVIGRKARLEAAERLARSGALSGSQLLAAYTEARASASGGVWDRTRAIRALDIALTAADPAAVAAALPEAWEEAMAGGVAGPLADALYPRIARLDGIEGGRAQGAALRFGLLSPDYETAAEAWPLARGPHLEAARAVAQGAGFDGATDRLDAAIADAFGGAEAPARLTTLARSDRLGEALLAALDDLAAGAAGDRVRLTGALAFLRGIGLESTARRTATELLLSRSDA